MCVVRTTPAVSAERSDLDLSSGIRPIGRPMPANVISESNRSRGLHRRGQRDFRRTAEGRVTDRGRVAIIKSGVIDAEADIGTQPRILAQELVLEQQGGSNPPGGRDHLAVVRHRAHRRRPHAFGFLEWWVSQGQLEIEARRQTPHIGRIQRLEILGLDIDARGHIGPRDVIRARVIEDGVGAQSGAVARHIIGGGRSAAQS